MPFKSERQRRWMHAKKPKMAARWEREAAGKERGTSPMAGTRRYVGREKRIASKNPGMSASEVRKLANKRARKYEKRVAASGIKNAPKDKLARQVWKAKGSKADVVRAKNLSTSGKTSVVNQARANKKRGISRATIKNVRAVASSERKRAGVRPPSLSKAVKAAKTAQHRKRISHYQSANSISSTIRTAAGFGTSGGSASTGRTVRR